MSTRPQAPPKYRHYKPKNLSILRIDGRDIYLGRFNSPESWKKYARLIAGQRAHGPIPSPTAPEADPGGPSVSEMILSFWQFALGYYRHADGSSTGELDNLRRALGPLKRLYGGTPAREFSPKAL